MDFYIENVREMVITATGPSIRPFIRCPSHSSRTWPFTETDGNSYSTKTT